MRRLARVAPAYWLALLVLAWVPLFVQAGHTLDASGYLTRFEARKEVIP